MPSIAVTPKMIIVLIYFLSPNVEPAKVEVTTEGIRQNVLIIIKIPNLILVIPAKYVIRSFGVPGIKYSKAISHTNFLSSFRNFNRFKSRRSIIIEVNFLPKSLVNPKISKVAYTEPTRHSTVPNSPPKA